MIHYFEEIYTKILGRLPPSLLMSQFNLKGQININFYGDKCLININLSFFDCIYYEIFGNISEDIFWERTNENQTTQYIIQNPNFSYSKKIKDKDKDNILKYLYLEYNGRNLLELKDKKCACIGLTNLQEIFLKFEKLKLKEEEK